MSAQASVWMLLSAGLTGVAVAALMSVLVPPTAKLKSRIAPYTQHARTRLGSAMGPRVSSGPWSSRRFGDALGPLANHFARILGRLVDVSEDQAMMHKLTQAGLASGPERTDQLAVYRMKQMRAVAIGSAAGVILGVALSASSRLVLLLGGLGLIVGATRGRGRLERRIERRREAMRIEIYTVNQMLALHVRLGGGVIRALQLVVERGSGEVVSELREVLRLHRAGIATSDALRKWERLTPEPHCARTYALLAAADERGADLARGLLQLSDDVRDTRREAIRRSATKRRALMLIPTIAVLAPVLLLFVAAPLPRIIFGFD